MPAPSPAQPKSKALAQQVALQECFTQYHTSPHAERTAACFRTFEEIIPTIGPYSQLLRILVDELKNAVYSSALTAREVGEFDHVPYFVTVDRIGDAKQTQIDQIQAKLDVQLNKTRLLERDLLVINKRNMLLKQEMATRERSFEEAKGRILILEDSVLKDGNVREEIQRDCDAKIQEVKAETNTLHRQIEQASKVIEQLQVFKKAYTDLENSDPSVIPAGSKLRPLLNYDHRSLTIHAIQEDLHLLSQLDTILNAHLDDYEQSLQSVIKKRSLLNEIADTPEKLAALENDFVREKTDITKHIKSKLAEVNKEQYCLMRHTEDLKGVMRRLMDDETYPTVKRSTDAILRKYAVVLEYSMDNGKSYRSLKQVENCPQCAAPSIICPHRDTGVQTFSIGPNANAIRVFHPIWQNPDLEIEAMNADPLLSMIQDAPETLREDLQIQLPRRFRLLWRSFYKQHAGHKPRVPRLLGLDKVAPWMQEIYKDRFLSETVHETNNRYQAIIATSFQTFFYNWLKERYFLPEVALDVAYDILTLLIRHDTDNLQCYMFSKALVGDDDCQWKYLQLIRKYMEQHEVSDSDGYKRMLRVIYPFRQPEVLENLELEYVAFSKNRFTRESVIEYTRHMLDKRIEPNHKAFSHNLAKYDYSESGCLSLAQFEEALDTIYPPIDVELRKTRYYITQSYFPRNAVPLERLSSIGAYLALVGTQKNKWVPLPLVKGFVITVEVEENGWIKTRPDRRFGSIQNLASAAEEGADTADKCGDPSDAQMGMDGDDGEGTLLKEMGIETVYEHLPKVKLVALESVSLKEPPAAEDVRPQTAKSDNHNIRDEHPT